MAGLATLKNMCVVESPAATRTSGVRLLFIQLFIYLSMYFVRELVKKKERNEEIEGMFEIW